jgi:hypothetical protein
MEKFLGSRLLQAGFFYCRSPGSRKTEGGSIMKKFIGSFSVVAVILLVAGNVFALDLGTNITISDMNTSDSRTWYTDREDDEVEPGMVRAQEWDLEGFFLKDNMLSMVGGYDFENGVQGLDSGDIFLDINGDAVYGDIDGDGTAGNKVVQKTFGYDYVIDLDFVNRSYNVYQLTDNSRTVTSYYSENQGSNPWRYFYEGADSLTSGSFKYDTGVTDTGFSGTNHNVVSGFDLSFLGTDVDFMAHFTMECGNDNLMGQGVTDPVATPEPGTLVLLGAGLFGIVGLSRRKRA